jgi:hypothetical protein
MATHRNVPVTLVTPGHLKTGYPEDPKILQGRFRDLLKTIPVAESANVFLFLGEPSHGASAGEQSPRTIRGSKKAGRKRKR